MNGAALLHGPEPSSSSDGLRGLSAICAYSQYGEKTLLELITKHGFPAEQFFGAWESSKHLIDEWRIKRIRAKLCQAVSAPQISAYNPQISAYARPGKNNGVE